MKNYKNYCGKRSGRGVEKWLIAFLALVLAGVLAFGTLFGIVVTGAHDEINGEPQMMIILGCQVKPWGPSVLLQDRLDKALEYLDQHPDMVVVAAGGQGSDEHVSEARAIADYLIEHGFPENQILLEDQSHNTEQNLYYAVDLLTAEGYDVTADVVIVSNGFHLARVRMLWARACGTAENLSTLAAPSSHVPSRIKMYIREPLALVKSFLFDRGV